MLRQVRQVPRRSLLLPLHPLLHGKLQVRLQLPLLTLHQKTGRQARTRQRGLQEALLRKLLPLGQSLQVHPRPQSRALHLQLLGKVQVFKRGVPLFPRKEGGRQRAMLLQPHGGVQERELRE